MIYLRNFIGTVETCRITVANLPSEMQSFLTLGRIRLSSHHYGPRGSDSDGGQRLGSHSHHHLGSQADQCELGSVWPSAVLVSNWEPVNPENPECCFLKLFQIVSGSCLSFDDSGRTLILGGTAKNPREVSGWKKSCTESPSHVEDKPSAIRKADPLSWRIHTGL